MTLRKNTSEFMISRMSDKDDGNRVLTMGQIIGENVKTLRGAKGWSQYDLAEHALVNQGTISSIERGDVASPQAETIVKIANALGVEPDYLRINGTAKKVLSVDSQLATEKLMQQMTENMELWKRLEQKDIQLESLRRQLSNLAAEIEALKKSRS